MTGSPSVISKASAGIAALSEKALDDIFWHPVQWHAMVKSGFARIFNRTRPHRQPPVQGRFTSVIATSLRHAQSSGRRRGVKLSAAGKPASPPRNRKAMIARIFAPLAATKR
jgi:hypothetical protein